MNTRQNDRALLLRLQKSGLEFVVIGGVCAVYHGVPIATFDLEICCPFGVENISKLEAAISDLHPCHRLTPNKLPLELSRVAFPDLKNLCLQTDLGKLDCLSEVAGIGDFNAVRSRSVLAGLSYGKFRFLDMDALITAKEAVGRERDLVAVRSLLAIRERKAGRKPDQHGPSA
jgi:hypothetical protein